MFSDLLRISPQQLDQFYFLYSTYFLNYYIFIIIILAEKKENFVIFMYGLPEMREMHTWRIKMNVRCVINVNGNIIRLKIINLARNYSIKQPCSLINLTHNFFSLIQFYINTRVSDSKYTLHFLHLKLTFWSILSRSSYINCDFFSIDGAKKLNPMNNIYIYI